MEHCLNTIRVYPSACTHARTHTYTHTHAHTCARKGTCTCTTHCTCMHACVHMPPQGLPQPPHLESTASSSTGTGPPGPPASEPPGAAAYAQTVAMGMSASDAFALLRKTAPLLSADQIVQLMGAFGIAVPPGGIEAIETPTAAPSAGVSVAAAEYAAQAQQLAHSRLALASVGPGASEQAAKHAGPAPAAGNGAGSDRAVGVGRWSDTSLSTNRRGFGSKEKAAIWEKISDSNKKVKAPPAEREERDRERERGRNGKRKEQPEMYVTSQRGVNTILGSAAFGCWLCFFFAGTSGRRCQ